MKCIVRFICLILLTGILRGFLPSPAVAGPCTADPAELKRAKTNYEKARVAYANSLVNQAWKYIRIAENIEPCYAELHLLKAEMFENEKRLDSAISSYVRALAINPDIFPNAYYFLANLETRTGKYADADIHFRKLLTYNTISDGMRDKAEMALMRNRATLKIMKEQVPFSPINLGPAINTEYEEYLPIVTLDDSMMIFTRRYMKADPVEHLEEDFFCSYRDSLGRWTPAIPLPGEVNSSDNEGAESISPDGRYLFFAGCNRPDGMGSCDIYVSYKTADGWGTPRNIGSPINTSHWESQPCMSSDGKTLYFVSNRPGGFGKSDIWKSELRNGIWTRPINLGPSINTAGDENSPYLHPDGKTLYFSSNGRGGMGGMDLFVVRLDERGDWGTPQNLGYPINTFADEVTLSVNARGDTAYFSSDHLGGYGKKDIYAFPLHDLVRPSTVSFMKGFVTDAKTGKPLPAKFELINVETQKMRVESQADAHNGSFLVCLPCDENFALNISCPGYLFHSEHIQLDGEYLEKPMIKRIGLQPIEKSATIVLNNIFYKTNEYALEETSITELSKIFVFLRNNPSVRVEISGHTDNVGAADYNKALSLKRAQAVADYLTNSGIDESRIIAKGYGAEKPVADNDTEEGRAKNRRTEMKIL